MALRLILVISLGMVLPILYFVLKQYGAPQGNQVFGVTIGAAHFKDERVAKIQKQYIRDMNWCGAISLVTMIGCIFIPWFSICYTVTMYWMFLVVIAFTVPFMKANSKVTQLKAENGWSKEYVHKVVVDTEVVKQYGPTLFRGIYIVSGILSVLPIVVYGILFAKGKEDMATFLTILLLSGMAIFMIVLGILIQKVPFKEKTRNSEINQAVARTKRYHWSKGMAGCTLSTAIFTDFLTIELYSDWISPTAVIIASLAYATFVMAYLFYCIYKSYRIKVKLMGEEEVIATDEDEYWIHGMFYYNKSDTHFMVEKRVGTGSTINMSRPAAKVCGGILLLLILLLPLSSISMIGDEFTAVGITITKQEVKSKYFNGDYSIPFSKIQNVELLTDKLKATRKQGTEMDNLKRGNYKVEGYGSCKLCLDPRNHTFLVIKTEKTTYIISGKDDTATKDAYDKLLLHLDNL